MATHDYASTRLRQLKGSDFEVADGQPDIRGWNVKDDNGHTIGEVDDLIFDEKSMKVRYMVVDLDDNDLDLDDHDVLIPIGMGEIPDNDDVIIIPNITATQLSALPKYKKNAITDEDEYSIRNAFAGAGFSEASSDIINEDFYNHEYYNQDNLHRRRKGQYANNSIEDNVGDTNTADTTNTTTVTSNKNQRDTDTTGPINTSSTTRNTSGTGDAYESNTANTTSAGRSNNQERTIIPVIEENVEIGKQQVTTGGAYIRARVVEKPIEETVNLREEHLNIERRTVDRPATSKDFDTFKEGVIELEEHAEVPIINKQARVVEEISVSKEVSERTETVHDTVRKTEIDVENLEDRSSGSYKSDNTRNL